MPSQVIDDKGYDGAKADLWSCGVILFVLMAGYLPFDEPSLMTLYKKVCFSLKRVKRYFFPLILVLDLLG
jgi:serine/threonine protein kinase